LAFTDTFSKPEPISSLGDSRFPDFTSRQSAGLSIFSRLTLERIQNDIMTGQNNMHRIIKADWRATIAPGCHENLIKSSASETGNDIVI